MNLKLNLLIILLSSFVIVQAQTKQGYYFEGFEESFPPTGWKVVDLSDSTNGWKSSARAEQPDAYEGKLSAHCQWSPDIGDDYLIAPAFLTAANDSLSFYFKFQYFNFVDTTFILVSVSDSLPGSFTHVLDIIADTTNGAGELGKDWVHKSYSLAPFAEKKIFIAFRNKNLNGDGIFIDNVEIGTRPETNLGVVSIDMDDFYPSGISIPKATFKNNGSATKTFDVTFSTNKGYSSTKTIILSSLSKLQVDFEPFEAKVGNVTLKARLQIDGDYNPNDNLLSKVIRVMDTFPHFGWQIKEPMPEAVYSHTATSIISPSGTRIFSWGGSSDIQTFKKEGYEYDTDFETWSAVAPMPIIGAFQATSTSNGKIFVFTGHLNDNVDPAGITKIYDIKSDSWTIGAAMPIPASHNAFVTYKDSLVYILGGNIGSFKVTKAVQIYNMYTGAWSSGTPLPDAAGKIFAKAGIIGNKIIITSGRPTDTNAYTAASFIGIIDTIDPTHIEWTSTTNYPLGQVSWINSSGTIDKASGLVYFSGGYDIQKASPTGRTFAYDLYSNSWKLGPSKPTKTSNCAMAPIFANDTLYLAAFGGGDFYAGIVYNTNEWLNLGPYKFNSSATKSQKPTPVNIHLYPNPAFITTHLSFELKESKEVRIAVLDTKGNEAQSFNYNAKAGSNSLDIDLKGLASGVYFIQLNVDGVIASQKLIKIK